MRKRQKAQLKSIILCILTGLLAAGCAAVRLPLSPPADEAVYYTDEKAAELFADENQYAMTGLERHEVYLLGKELNADFYFAENVAVDDAQIDNARSFVLTAFALRHPSAAEESPYSALIANQQVQWASVSCRVYIGQALMYHDRYDGSGRLVKEENTEPTILFEIVARPPNCAAKAKPDIKSQHIS